MMPPGPLEVAVLLGLEQIRIRQPLAGQGSDGLVSSPRWDRIFLITSGYSMADMIFIFPEHKRQVSTSMLNRRLRSFAQEMRELGLGSLQSQFGFYGHHKLRRAGTQRLHRRWRAEVGTFKPEEQSDFVRPTRH